MTADCGQAERRHSLEAQLAVHSSVSLIVRVEIERRVGGAMQASGPRSAFGARGAETLRSSATRLRGCTLFVQRACRTTRSMRQWIGTRHVSAAGFEPVMLGCRSRAALDWCAERSGFRISPRRWDVAGAGAVMRRSARAVGS